MNRIKGMFSDFDEMEDPKINLHSRADDDWLEEREDCRHSTTESEVLVGKSDLIYPNWTATLTQAFVSTLARVEEGFRKNSRLNAVNTRLQALENRLAESITRDSVIVPISTFAPEPIDVLKEIKVVVQKDEDEFIATFFDANVNAAGCNQVEAIDNLKDLILSRFEFLTAQRPEKLGPALAKQIAVLREFIRRRS